MKRKLILTLALICEAGCVSGSVSQAGRSTDSNRSAPQVLTSDTSSAEGKVGVGSADSTKEEDIPAEFAMVDFRNLSYPVDWKKKRVRLENGRRDYDDPKDLWNHFTLGDVYYVDFDGDGKKEAIVELIWVHCGGDCDEGSSLFYFYTIRRGTLKLLQRISTGSLSYGCGLKDFTPDGETLTIEVFRNCSYSVGTFTGKQQFGRDEAHEFTRFSFKFVQGKFTLKKREVFPHPSGNVLIWD